MNKKSFIKIFAIFIFIVLGIYLFASNINIKISGVVSREISQHPIFEPELNILYLDTNFGQVVLYSKDKINCQAKITVFGKLKMICLGGMLGTKSDYCGFSMKVNKWLCE